MSYLIDRQAVIDLLKQMRKDGDMVPWEGRDVFARIRKLPTIQPEKAQLSQEGTTSDLISRTETVEHLRRVLDVTVPITDYDEGYVDGVEFGISTVSTMPTIQPQSTTGQLNDGAQSTAQSTDLISRQAALNSLVTMVSEGLDWIPAYHIKELPSAQPERKTGKWMPDNRAGGGFWVCSCCKFPSEAFAADVLYKFCPNCGAKMTTSTK